MRDQHNTSKPKWQAKKLAKIHRMRYRDTGSETELRRSIRIDQCANMVWIDRCDDCGQIIHQYTYGCGDRLCPICARRKARATAAQALDIVDLLEASGYTRYAMLTLTRQNVPGDGLAAAIDGMLEGWDRLNHVRAIKRAVAGYARTIEITHNATRQDYHPHIHVILVLADDAPAEILKADFWARLWWRSARLEQTIPPVVEVHPLHGGAGDAVYEVSKYVAKVGKLLDLPLDAAYEVICTIDDAIRGRRLRSYGGIWRKLRIAARMPDADQMSDAQLNEQEARLPDVCAQCGSAKVVHEVLVWSGTEYVPYTGDIPAAMVPKPKQRKAKARGEVQNE